MKLHLFKWSMCLCVFISEVDAHELVLDVKTRWNSTYFMIERFVEQYPAIQATVLDPRIRKGADKLVLEYNLNNILSLDKITISLYFLFLHNLIIDIFTPHIP